MLRDHCDSIYVLDVTSGDDVLPVLRADGSPTFERHVLNELRKNIAVRNEYKDLIKSDGIRKGARAGHTIGVPSSFDRKEMVVRLVAGATLIEALLLAHSEDPDNPQASIHIVK